MDAYNLAVVIGPTLLPVDEKLAMNSTQRVTKTCELLKVCIFLLILPDYSYNIQLLLVFSPKSKLKMLTLFSMQTTFILLVLYIHISVLASMGRSSPM